MLGEEPIVCPITLIECGRINDSRTCAAGLVHTPIKVKLASNMVPPSVPVILGFSEQMDLSIMVTRSSLPTTHFAVSVMGVNFTE